MLTSLLVRFHKIFLCETRSKCCFRFVGTRRRYGTPFELEASKSRSYENKSFGMVRKLNFYFSFHSRLLMISKWCLPLVAPRRWINHLQLMHVVLKYYNEINRLWWQRTPKQKKTFPRSLWIETIRPYTLDLFPQKCASTTRKWHSRRATVTWRALGRWRPLPRALLRRAPSTTSAPARRAWVGSAIRCAAAWCSHCTYPELVIASRAPATTSAPARIILT